MLYRNILRFVALVLIQVLVLNNINFSGYLNPYLYVLFILLLPLSTPQWALLVSSFFLGFCVDLFSNTYGMHAAASVFMAYARPAVLRMLETGTEYEPDMTPGIRDLGFTRFFTYALILIFLHHSVLIFIEVFRFSEFFTTLFRIVLSTFFTLAMVIIAQYIFHKSKS